ncbi:MAG: nucleotidyltransferase domain-containing protein [Solirubrobacteraceae bacterium]
MSVAAWASARPDVPAIGLVGSWARNEAGAESDLDIVLLTGNPGAYVEDDGWIAELGARSVVRTRRWGAITERRIVLASGLELDVGIGEPSWAATTPVDPGTRRVVSDGMRIVHDPDGLLRALIAACAEPSG